MRAALCGENDAPVLWLGLGRSELGAGARRRAPSLARRAGRERRARSERARGDGRVSAESAGWRAALNSCPLGEGPKHM
eukprot:4587088-Pyramimonas_sp.AAC.1